ncbi:MAG: septal ring lytic transglycosylase RlpA family protein [Hyphomicrobiales bacterium]|nr:septal ring lytic transglycosylase RlpA family protein [Hyphomicrobiales bacterium]
MRNLLSTASCQGWRGACDAVRMPHIRTWLALTSILFLSLAIGLGGCGRSDKRQKTTKLSKRVVTYGQPVPKGGGRYKVGKPYQIAGKWFRPKEDNSYNKVGVASWYGDLFHGRYTANGEVFDMDALTAAHPTLPLPVYAEVTNLKNGRSIVVRVNDRGPYAHNRIIDLSRRSAQVLGFQRAGTAKVKVRYMGRAPLNGDDSYERQVLASKSWSRQPGSKAPKVYAKAVAQTINRRRRKVQAAAPVAVASLPRPTRNIKTVTARSSAKLTTSEVRDRMARGIKQPLVFVQAGSFRRRENADSVRRQLTSLGQVQVFPAEIAGTTWYRVRLGPFQETRAADEALQKVVASGAGGARIVQN